jgi:hypothetical protein
MIGGKEPGAGQMKLKVKLLLISIAFSDMLC